MNLRFRLEIEPTVLFKYIYILLIWLCWVLAEACWILLLLLLVAAWELLVLAHKI